MTFGRKFTVSVLAIILLAGCGKARLQSARSLARSADIREGDVVFQSLSGPVCEMIEGATGSPYSHCGIMVRGAGGGLAVLEALGWVRERPLDEWIAGGRGMRIAVYRFSDQQRGEIPAVIKACRMYSGRPYDIRYRMDDARIYCSELIYKGVRDATGREMAPLVRLCDLDWQPHRRIIEEIEGGEPPLEREMITPHDLAASKDLELVFSNYPTPKK